MRKLPFITLVLLLVAVGCSLTPEHRPMFRWTPVSPRFDSLVVELENAYISATPFERKGELTGRLASMEPEALEQAGRLQTLYWRARMEKGGENEAAADSLSKLGIELCDSAAYPYEYARLVSIVASLSMTSPDDAYRMSARNLAYFEATADSFMLGAVLMRLGGVMWQISDTIPAANYYRRADTVYSRLNLENYRIKNLLNIANTLTAPSTRAQCDSIMSYLLESKVALADSGLYQIVLKNAYLNTGDFSYLRRAYGYVGKMPRNDAVNAFYESAIAEYYIDSDGPHDSIVHYARMAFDRIDNVSDRYTRAVIFNAMAYTMYVSGDFDSALGFYRAFLDSRLEIEHERFSLETTKAEHRSLYEKAQVEQQHRRVREKTFWIVTCVLLVTLGGVGLTVLYLRAENARISRREGEVELQRHRNHLSACVLAMEEKDGLIDAVVKCVDRMSAENKIGAKESREITMTIRQYLNNRMERETFRSLHEKLHPEFMKRLKADYPMLTESQLKHAAYISMGMTSKQISQALNIEYDSVKKSRSRLRQRMGLPPEQSLEDVLRGYS